MLLIQSDCDRYQYDIFQRYDLLRRVLIAAFASRARGQPVRVLDVGSGPKSLNEEFLPPWFHVTRSDVCTFDDPEIVVLTPGQPLPFTKDAFDVVLAIEVLEHLPAHEREFLIQECVRVSSQLAVFSFPRHSPQVKRAEATLNHAFRVAFGKENSFLNEHSMMGLPKPLMVRQTLERLHVDFVETSNSPLWCWLLFSVFDVFYCAQFGDGKEKDDFNRRMNSFRSGLGQEDEYYRACFFALKNPDLYKEIDSALATPAADCAEQNEQEWQFLMTQELLEFFGQYRDSWSGRYEQLAKVKDQYITMLRDAVDGKEHRITGLDEALQARQQELDRVTTSLSQLTASHEQKEQKLAEATAQIAEKTKLVTERDAQITTLIAQLSSQTERVSAHEQTILELDSRNATLHEINTDQAQVIRELNQSVQHVQAQRAQLQRTLDGRIRQLDRLTTSFSWRYTRPARIVQRWIHRLRRRCRGRCLAR